MAELDERGYPINRESQAGLVADKKDTLLSELGNGVSEYDQPTGEARELEVERSDRIAELVHDLRTPLTAIRGYTRMILEERTGSVNSTQREYLTVIAENTSRIIQILNDLVQLTANQPLHMELFDVRELWPQVLRLAQSRFSEKSVCLQERFPSEQVLIRGDKHKLAEAFSEFLSCCVGLVDPHGEIVMELSPGPQKDSTIRFIATSGQIPTKIHEAFNRGTQQHGSSPENQKDLGLGLSLACNFIRLHGGRASVSSKPGEGFSFAISLPALSRKENI